MTLDKPDLYRPSEDGARMLLRVSRCRACGGLMFPRALHGCRACGATLDQTEEEMLSGDATLISFVTVYQKLGPGLEPPFVVGEAEIAEGMVEEIMIDAPEEALSVGMRLVAAPRAITRDGAELITCRFVPVAAE